ncbi:hypothetical protein ACJJTC_016942 [Scirpophaga incertulas]
MPRKSKSRKTAAEKALKMHAVVRARKNASATKDNIISEKHFEDSIQTETTQGSNQSTHLLHVSETRDKDPTRPIQESAEHVAVELTTPQKKPSSSVSGRRIIDITYFYSRLQEISEHGPMDCGLGCVEIVGERQVGLHSKFKLKCKMCRNVFYIENDPPGENNINTCAVAGTISIGCGHSQLQELSAALNLPIMTPKTYGISHCKLSNYWEKVSVESMNAAAEKERQMSIAEGRVDQNGIPIIDVIVDGCWSKRTYKKNYSALSGAAAIIGRKTGEILFLGVKNKYCSICSQAEKAKKVAKKHKCYKNYSEPSTAMESTIILEGFKCSIAMHNLIYGRIISDGDSSTYIQLLKSRPYSDITVEKIECRNHLLRNFRNKLTALQTDTKFILNHRKVITQKKIMILRKTVRQIIKAYKADSESERRCNIEFLYNDLLLAHLHAFDDHSRCKPIFCNVVEENLQSTENDFFSGTLWSRICLLMSNLSSHAPSLIHDVDNNTVERYNSIVAKIVGGKRINFSKRGSYQTRCHAAVVSFNTHKVISSVYKSMTGHSPRGSVKRLESRRMKRAMIMRKIERKKNRMLFSKGEDINYGEKCESLILLQSSCSEWLELRRKLLTASNFGKVIKRRNDISCHNIVKDILYKDSIAHIKSLKHGKDNEQKALIQLENQENIQISPCGLYIDEEYHFLGATPDGLIDNDTIVELKCPLSAYEKDLKEVVKNKKFPFYKISDQGELMINKTHNWYYQVQGQLHITRKPKCLFAIWTGDHKQIKTEIILKDDEVWDNAMKQKLILFYTECMLPELVDPRIPRNMKIRDPVHIQEAINNKKPNRKYKTINIKNENKYGDKKQKNTQQDAEKNKGLKRKHIGNENEQIMKQGKGQNNQRIPTEEQNKKQKLCDKENRYDGQGEGFHDNTLPVLMTEDTNTHILGYNNNVRELKFTEF